jgi:hypothetical protein
VPKLDLMRSRRSGAPSKNNKHATAKQCSSGKESPARRHCRAENKLACHPSDHHPQLWLYAAGGCAVKKQPSCSFGLLSFLHTFPDEAHAAAAAWHSGGGGLSADPDDARDDYDDVVDDCASVATDYHHGLREG